MADPNPQLVEQITALVLAELASRGLVADRGAAAGHDAGPRAEIHPPAGVCTGDYSKFPELAGMITTPPPASAPEATPAASPQPDPATSPAPVRLAGLVTESQLQDALRSAGDAGVLLARDARLTPLASDMARRLRSRIVREGQASKVADGPAARRDGGLPWLWWIDGHCPAVPGIVERHGRRLVPASAPRTGAGLAQAIRDVATGLRQQRIAGAVLLAPTAARAMCLANRSEVIRAVLGTCPEAVAQAISQIGANVLILEYPYTSGEKMAAMIETMLQKPPRPSALVARELDEARRW